jgi:hypothetical protein
MNPFRELRIGADPFIAPDELGLQVRTFACASWSSKSPQTNTQRSCLASVSVARTFGNARLPRRGPRRLSRCSLQGIMHEERREIPTGTIGWETGLKIELRFVRFLRTLNTKVMTLFLCTCEASSSTPHANYGMPLVKFTKPTWDRSYYSVQRPLFGDFYLMSHAYLKE